MPYTKEQIEILNYVHEWTKGNIVWTSDWQNWGQEDYWVTLKEMRQRFGYKDWKEDCDGFATVSMGMLIEKGFDPHELRFCICELQDPGEYYHQIHSVLLCVPTGDDHKDGWIIDQRQEGIWQAKDMTNLKPLLSFTIFKGDIKDYVNP